MPSVTASQIAASLNAVLSSSQDFAIKQPATADDLKPNSLTFLSKPTPERIANIGSRQDVLVLVKAETEEELIFPHIKVPNPRLSFARVLAEFFAPKITPSISPTAMIDKTARIGKDVHIGHYTIIGAGVEIADGTYVGNNVEIFPNVKIGSYCNIKSRAVIGQEGFGVEKDEKGNYLRVPHLGSVIIDDFVELGSCSTIASGTIKPTLIGAYTKIDDHCHIGHNCKIGKNNVICGGTIISGSVTAGDDVWFGPNSCMMQGVNFQNGCVIGVGAVMYTNGKANTTYGTRPALPMAPPKE